MANTPSGTPDEQGGQLPEIPAEIFVPEIDSTESTWEKEKYQKQRSDALSYALKKWYDGTQLENLDEFEDLEPGDVLFYTTEKGQEHAIVEENNNGKLTIRYFWVDGKEIVSTTYADEITLGEEMEVFVIRWAEQE